MSEIKEITSLIKLLDDPDNQVFELVKNKLNKLGTLVIPYLETAWENSFDELFQSRIEDITQSIQFSVIKNKLYQWNSSEHQNLFEGALMIATYEYAEIDTKQVKKQFDQIKQTVWLELNEQFTALEKTRIINHVFYKIYAFERSTTFFRSAQSHFINNLLTTKKGSPIALAILYAAIAQELDLPIYGVALPKNFIVCYKNVDNQIFNTEFQQHILFYINPFNKGIAFGKYEIDEFIKQQKLEHKMSYFKPCSNKETIVELLKTLINFYENNRNEVKINDYKILLEILNT